MRLEDTSMVLHHGGVGIRQMQQFARATDKGPRGHDWRYCGQRLTVKLFLYNVVDRASGWRVAAQRPRTCG